MTGDVKITWDAKDPLDAKVTLDGQEVRGLVAVRMTAISVDNPVPLVTLTLEPGTLEIDGMGGPIEAVAPCECGGATAPEFGDIHIHIHRTSEDDAPDVGDVVSDAVESHVRRKRASD